MSLNIKDEETHRLAQELAAATGESMSAAVKTAVRERLQRVHREKEDKFERIMAIARRSAAHFSEEAKKINPDDLLYDERGLPK